MKRISTAALALLVTIAGAPVIITPAIADENAKLNCSLLNGEPYVCVVNHKPIAITNIRCVGSWGTERPVNIPGGVIDPGEVTVLKLGKDSRCDNKIVIKLSDGHEQEFNGFDTNANTELNIK